MTSSITSGKKKRVRASAAGQALPTNNESKAWRPGQWVRMGEGGRIVIPAEMRAQLGIGPGDDLLLDLQDGEMRVLTRRGAIKRVQERFRPYLQGTPSLVDELIAERRAEAAAE